jgi:hypothetical protein
MSSTARGMTARPWFKWTPRRTGYFRADGGATLLIEALGA